MSEKKAFITTLSTLFLLLSIIAVSIIGYFVYNLYIDYQTIRKEFDNKLSYLQTTIDTLADEITNLQTTIDNFEETSDISSNTQIPESNNNSSNTQVGENNNNPSKISGTYIINVNTDLLGEDSSASDETIEFLDENKFRAYVGWGNNVFGTYTITNNTINCTITSFSGEYSPEQKTNAQITFEVVDNSTIKILSASKTYKVKISTLIDGSWTLTDQDKDMFLTPFIQGIEFNLEK